MKIPGVFTIVLVAGAATASAQPVHHENAGRVSYKDDRPTQHTAPQDGWVQLATPTPASHGTEFIVVGADQGQFAQVRVDASKGRIELRRVTVYFVDGHHKTIDVDRVIDARKHGSELIDLHAPVAIDRIVVSTEPQSRGSYAIYGTGGTGGMARR